MKNNTIIRYIGLFALVSAFMAVAHDPKEHTTTTEKPNCDAMNEMDLSTMDINNPVVVAMMQQCSKEKEAKHENHTEAPQTPTNEPKLPEPERKHH